MANPRILRDNPGGEWEQKARERARKTGDMGPLTCTFSSPILMRTDDLLTVPGRMDEHLFRDYFVMDTKMQRLVKDVGDPSNFNTHKNPPMLWINYDGKPFMGEGNHRLGFARHHDIKVMWIDVRYYAGGENMPSRWKPEKLLADHNELIKEEHMPETAAKQRDTWKDGHWKAEVGDKVYMRTTGFGGGEAHVYGEVFKRSGVLRIRITGAGSIIGGGYSGPKTVSYGPHWIVKGDPTPERLAKQRRDAETQESQQRENTYQGKINAAKEAVLKAIKQGAKPLTATNAKIGLVVFNCLENEKQVIGDTGNFGGKFEVFTAPYTNKNGSPRSLGKDGLEMLYIPQPEQILKLRKSETSSTSRPPGFIEAMVDKEGGMEVVIHKNTATGKFHATLCDMDSQETVSTQICPTLDVARTYAKKMLGKVSIKVETSSLYLLECATDSWWKQLNNEEKGAYVKANPRSQYIHEATIISLKKKSGGDVEGFMKEFEANTQAHPWNDKSRIVGSTMMELYPFNGKIHLSDIQTMSPKSGAGTEAMRYLLSLADKYHVVIEGTAKAYAPKGAMISNTAMLRKWYEKLGFKVTGGSKSEGFEIEYTPK